MQFGLGPVRPFLEHRGSSPQGRTAVDPKSQSKHPEVSYRTPHDPRVRPGCATGCAGVVWDALLDDDPTTLADLDEQLCRQEGATGFDVHTVEGVTAEELAGAIGVLNLQAEEQA